MALIREKVVPLKPDKPDQRLRPCACLDMRGVTSPLLREFRQSVNSRDRIRLVSKWFEWSISEFGSQEVGSHPFLDHPVYPVYLELVFQYRCQYS